MPEPIRVTTLASKKCTACLVTLEILLVALIVVTVVYALFSNSASYVQSSVANFTGSRVTSSLTFIIVVSRHGNRSPITEFPKDPYQPTDRSVWPEGQMQLTKRGRQQMYRLGQKVRSLYNGFLSQTYYKEDVKAYSTLVDRVMMSAEAFLAGLYPPTGFQVWTNDLPWQPIPVFPTSLDHTMIVPLPHQCPRFEEDQQKSLDECKQRIGDNVTAVLDSIKAFTGLETTSENVLYNLGTVWDTLVAADFEGLPLPTWASAVYPEPLQSFIQVKFEAAGIATDTMIRLLEGPLFKEMVEIMQKRNDKSRMSYFSGHDYTLLGLNAILGVPRAYNGIISPGSALILELHRDQQPKIYNLQVLYIDGGSENLDPVRLPIPITDFHTLLSQTKKYYNISDFEKECQTHTL